MKRDKLRNEIFTIPDENTFVAKAIEVFRYQYEENTIYQKFVDGFKTDIEEINSIEKIPFLPVELFKTHKIKSGNFQEQKIFTSSGTTSNQSASHFVRDLKIYEEAFIKSFETFYGYPGDYVFLALLPSYLERSGSSLIFMMEELIKLSGDKRSGFFLDEFDQLFEVLTKLKEEKRKTILIGVTYALIDFAEAFQINFPELIVMETGGMKGKRKEMIRAEVHELIKPKFGVDIIHSEYGMTELMSQSYSFGNGIFKTPSWMRVFSREMYDPMQYCNFGATGGLNIVDLANIDSCSFVSTQDLGKVYENHSFEIIGRFDDSDIRGCNLMIE